MKKGLKSALSVLLAVVLMMSVVQISVSAAQTTPMTITASTKTALPGSSVDVEFSLKDNPGVSSIGLDVGYNKNILSLEKVTYNTGLGGITQSSPLTDNPAKLLWVNSTEEFGEDAVFATLTFKVSANAKGGVKLPITITYDENDIYNSKEENINCEIVNGAITITDVIPGDINNDKAVNNKDVTRLMQYLAHWDVEVNEITLDTNGDKAVNNKDVSRLMQYLAHWEVVLHPTAEDFNDEPIDDCEHLINRVNEVLPTCSKEGHIAYYQCSICGKKFSDFNGISTVSDSDLLIPKLNHTIVIDPAIAPTSTTEGKTEGSHCSVCGEIIIKQETIPPLEGEVYSITYHPYADDTYLQRVGVNNTNPNYYSSQDGLRLQNLKVEGYVFEGWYDGEGANGELVKTIPVGAKGEYELFARWTPREYTITFNSPLVPVIPQKYQVNTGATLVSPSLNGYNFIGWCDENNNLVTEIPTGKTGNITLYANWTSKRNQTRPVSRLEDPLILEDAEKGTILFAYEIGTVENVPISQISEMYQSVGGMKQTFTTQESVNITDTEAKNVAKTVGNSTTESKAWSLSEEWNDVTTVSESYAEQKGWTKEEAEQHSKTSSNTYSMNSSSGGSQTNTSSSGLSGTLSTSNSSTAGGSYSAERETGSEYTVSEKASLNSEAAFKAGFAGNEVSGKVSAGIETSESAKNYEKNKSSVGLSYSDTGTSGQSVTGQSSNVSSGSSSWNTSSGYSSSNSVSSTSSVRNVLSEVINTSKSYGSSYARGGSNNESQSFANSSTESNQYSSAITFAKGETTTNTKTIELGGNSEGYYRFVLAGTAHVFAVVGYDVAKSAYFTYTYTVMDDKTYTFIDYSKTTPAFNDNENGVLPFEVPYFVKDYVDLRLRQSDGLQISQEGKVTGYTGTDSIIFIPSYYKMNNLDGTYTSIKVTEIGDNVFANKDITAVMLSSFITEIPNGAFKNCSMLSEIIAPGITSIGQEAFKGCVKLGTFNVPKSVTSIGEKAFDGVPKISVDAASVEAAKGTIESGAKEIVLNISDNPDLMSNSEFVISDSTDYFELRGNAKEYRNIRVVSDAKKTVINGLTINCEKGIPISISSPEIVLNRVNINSKGYAALFKNPESDIALYGSVKLNSDNGKAFVSRSINLSQIDPTISSTLSISGNVLLCGEISGQELLTLTNGSIIVISAEDFEKYAKGAYEVSFYGNGGNVKTVPKTVYYGTSYGELPIPTRDYYNFVGWFTDSDEGVQITEDDIFEGDTDIALYAHWDIKPTSDWILESNLPEGARVESEKWSYTEREYTSNSASSLSGWTKYDTRRTSWGATQGPVYSNPDNGSRNVWSEQYVASTTTHYKYWRYVNPEGTYMSNTGSGWNGCTIYQEIDLTYPLSWMSNDGNFDYYGEYVYNGNTYLRKRWFSGGSYVTNNYGTRWYYQDPIYTYYYYRDVNKESASEITDGGDISNTQKWVKYINK